VGNGRAGSGLAFTGSIGDGATETARSIATTSTVGFGGGAIRSTSSTVMISVAAGAFAVVGRLGGLVGLSEVFVKIGECGLETTAVLSAPSIITVFRCLTLSLMRRIWRKPGAPSFGGNLLPTINGC